MVRPARRPEVTSALQLGARWGRYKRTLELKTPAVTRCHGGITGGCCSKKGNIRNHQNISDPSKLSYDFMTWSWLKQKNRVVIGDQHLRIHWYKQSLWGLSAHIPRFSRIQPVAQSHTPVSFEFPRFSLENTAFVDCEIQ